MARAATHPIGHGTARGRGRALSAGFCIGIGVAVVAVVVLAVVLANVSSSNGGGSRTSSVSVSGPARSSMLQTGDKVPAFSGPGLTGGRVGSAQFAGHPAVLEIWAPWCPHCQAELPIMGQVAPQFPGVEVVMIETAMGQEPGPSGEGFFAQHHLTFPSAVDDANGTLAAAMGVQGFPTVYFVGSDGRVVDSFTGEASAPAIAGKFRELQSLEQ